jgi:hypothetical protein
MPAAWNRLADATTPGAVAQQLSVVTLGHVHVDDLAALTPHFQKVEQLVLDVAPRDELTQHRAELNRAIDAATGDWILVVREREVIDDALAGEIAAATTAGKARGFRIRSVPFYAGKPLRVGASAELRLLHRRYYIRFAKEMQVQGTVVRLDEPLRSQSFASVEEHRQYLEKNAVPHSLLRRLLLFAHHVAVTRALDANTLRYLWIEAGFDHT